MSKSQETPKEETVSAVKELLSREDLKDYFTELSIMHGAFIKSAFADDQRVRVQVTNTFENLRDFLLNLQTIHSKKS